MTVALTGAGGLFTRTGHLAGLLNDLNSLLGGATTSNIGSTPQITTRLSQIEGDYAAGTALYSIIDGVAGQVSSFQSSAGSSLPTYLQSLAQSTIIQMVVNDSPLAAATLTNALAVLIQQMTGVASINGSTVGLGAQTAVGTPTGNPVFVLSKVDGAGQNLQYVIPETLHASMTADAQTGATAGSEPYSVIGQAALGSLLDYRFLQSPYGSGCNVTGSLVNGAVSNSAGGQNLLENSDFETAASTNYPQNWVLTTGVATTNVVLGTGSNAYATGGGSLGLVSDGSTLSAVTQQFNTATSTSAGSGGTAAVLKSGYVNNQPYCLNGWFKLSTGSPVNGSFIIELIDGSNAVIADDAATNNQFTKSLTSTSDTSWHNFNAVFRLPAVLPSTIKIRIRLGSTILDSGKTVYISRLSLAPMIQLYGGSGTAGRAGGPFIAGFSGNTAVSASALTPDSWTFAITNTVGAVAKSMWQFCNLPALGLVIPFSGSPTVNENTVA